MRSDQAAKELVPSACTLPTGERPMRQAEFDDLFATVLRTVGRPDRTHIVLALEAAPGRAESVRDLTRREAECCSFFTFTLTEQTDLLLLEIAVPPAHVDVLEGIVARVAPVSGLAR